MLTLYRRTGDGLDYWEAWAADGAVTIHWGHVGERGQTRRETVSVSRSADEVIEEAAGEPRAGGFAEPSPDAFHEVVVRFILEDGDLGSEAEILEFLAGLKRQLSECLGWTGNGRCTGGEVGFKQLEADMFCQVLEADAAVVSLAKHLETFGYGDEFIIGRRVGAQMRTVYPRNLCDDSEWLWGSGRTAIWSLKSRGRTPDED